MNPLRCAITGEHSLIPYTIKTPANFKINKDEIGEILWECRNCGYWIDPDGNVYKGEITTTKEFFDLARREEI